MLAGTLPGRDKDDLAAPARSDQRLVRGCGNRLPHPLERAQERVLAPAVELASGVMDECLGAARRRNHLSPERDQLLTQLAGHVRRHGAAMEQVVAKDRHRA